jgi:hypothetical protein
MAYDAEGVRPVPAREGVGGKPGMDHREMADKIRVRKVLPKILKHLFGHQHSLVYHDPGRKAADVKSRIFIDRRIPDFSRGHFTDYKKFSLKIVLRQAFGGFDKDLFHGGLTVHRPGAYHGRVPGNDPPTDGPLSELSYDFFERGLLTVSFPGVGGKKNNTRSVPAPFGQAETQFLGGFFKKFDGERDKNSRSVSGIFFAAHGAAMGHVHQDIPGVFNYRMTSVPLYMGHKTDTAAVLFEGRIVKGIFSRATFIHLGFLLYGLAV